MNRLKDRQRQIPNGFKLYLPQINWRAAPWSSFDSICMQMERVVRGNPAIAQQNKWPTTRPEIEEFVESYNVRLCESQGWMDYVTEGSPPTPKILPPQSPRALFARLAVGAATLVDYFVAGGQPVAQTLADSRSAICAGCPQNKTGDWMSWFTIPASNLIKKQLEKREELKLQTANDDRVGICDACGCPLKLKLHFPVDIIAQRMPAEDRAQLDPRCWILHESAR